MGTMGDSSSPFDTDESESACACPPLASGKLISNITPALDNSQPYLRCMLSPRVGSTPTPSPVPPRMQVARIHLSASETRRYLVQHQTARRSRPYQRHIRRQADLYCRQQ